MAAAIIILGLAALWGLSSAGAGWPLALGGGLALGALAVVSALAARLGALDSESARLFTRLPGATVLSVLQAPARIRAALRVIRTALGARSRAPVFVRLKLRPATPAGVGSVVTAMSAAPGAVVVDADAGSLLAHVLAEGDVDVAAMQRLERAALAASGGAAP